MISYQLVLLLLLVDTLMQTFLWGCKVHSTEAYTAMTVGKIVFVIVLIVLARYA